MKSVKIEKPNVVLTHADCRACGARRELDDFRVFEIEYAEDKSIKTKILMDFCVICERAHGTLALYRRYNAYGTPKVVDAVFAAARVQANRRTTEQVRLLIEPAPEKTPANTEQLVERELQRRELCRRRLIYFVQEMMPAYKAGWVHQDICRRLERFVKQVEAGMSPRLMLFMPPRAGKSQLVSDFLSSWILGLHPEWPIIATSYAQTLPLDFSRSIRDRMDDRDYKAIFPNTKLRPDAKGIEAWKTTAGGGYVAAGVGTGITGKGMMVGIADDLLKDQEAASSEVIRNSTFNWYTSTFRTRLAPGGGIIMVNTRWHFDDPTGRLINVDAELEKAGVPPEEREAWEVISYPAIAEHDEYLMRDGSIMHDAKPDEALRLLRRKGEALHPERYPLRELLKLKNTLPPSQWNALYQQAPVPDDGEFFLRDDLRYRWLDPAYRPLCRIFMTVDYAIKKDRRNDFTAMGCFALDSNDDLYVLEIRKGRWGTMQIVDNAVAMVSKHKPEVYAGEQGQIHAAVWPLISAALEKDRNFVSVDDTLVPIQDKEVRARPLQGRVQRNKLFFSHDEATKPDIYDQTEREMLQFPDGVHDDIVDMLAWGARLALNTSLPTTQAPPKSKSWKDKLGMNQRSAGSFMAT